MATNPSRRGRGIYPVLDRLGEVTGPRFDILFVSSPSVLRFEHDFNQASVPNGMQLHSPAVTLDLHPIAPLLVFLEVKRLSDVTDELEA